MHCSKCRTENVSDAKHCRHCGRALRRGKPRGALFSWCALGSLVLPLTTLLAATLDNGTEGNVQLFSLLVPFVLVVVGALRYGYDPATKPGGRLQLTAHLLVALTLFMVMFARTRY